MKMLVAGVAFGVVSLGLIGPAWAAHRHPAAKHPAKHRPSPAKHADQHRHGHAGKPSSPTGATSVPASGIKLFCGPRKTPLMVRKMTQGNGTTVTVICR